MQGWGEGSDVGQEERLGSDCGSLRYAAEGFALYLLRNGKLWLVGGILTGSRGEHT